MTESNCDGCSDSDENIHFNICELIFYNKNGSCPCTNCIVKMMCSDSCDKFALWWRAR